MCDSLARLASCILLGAASLVMYTVFTHIIGYECNNLCLLTALLIGLVTMACTVLEAVRLLECRRHGQNTCTRSSSI